MKKVKAIPAMEHTAQRDPWFDTLFDGELWELDESDWNARYATVRSASSAVKQAAQHRGLTAKVAIRGDKLFVQAILNGQTITKAAVKKATVKKAVAKKAGTPRPRKATARAS